MQQEIIVNQDRLRAATIILSQLQSGTGFLSGTEPVYKSVGAVADELNDTYRQLCKMERYLLDLIEQLCSKLQSAGIEFAQIDEANAQMLMQIHGILKG